MGWADGFIAVDWGTTNRRAYRIDANGQQCGEFEDGEGILSIAAGAFPAAVAQIRERLGDHPLLMAGMIGSNRGWVEAPYVPCPAGIGELAGALAWPAKDVAIVPGVCFSDGSRADVMRGEEVQLLGAEAARLVPPDCLVCHPGTHNKWAVLAGGRIERFRTVMTGELFNLLKGHSILSDLLQGEVEPNQPFAAGVRAGLRGDGLPAELFGVRARVLLGEARAGDAAAYTSGLLIGADVAIGLGERGNGAVIVMGRPELTGLYAAAIREAGGEAIELDGEQSFVAGCLRISELLP